MLSVVNDELSATDRQTPDLKPTAQTAVSKLFAVGVFGWLLGSLIVFGASWPISHPESISSALIWTISHCWTSFLFGLIALVGFGVVKRLSVGRAAFGYVLPVAILVLIGGLCLLVYPDNLLREELMIYLPVVFVFYVFGLLWMWMRVNTSEPPALARAVIPAVVGGLVILGFVAVPVFASDAFRYRDAFQLTVAKTTVRDGAIFVEGSIEIRKPGNYRFSAPRYVWAEMAAPESTEPQVELGEINWGATGIPQAGALGDFPLQIVWRRGVTQSTITEMASYEEFVSVEVRDPAQGEKVIYSMSAPLLNP